MTDEEFFSTEKQEQNTYFAEELAIGRERTKDINSEMANKKGDPLGLFTIEHDFENKEIPPEPPPPPEHDLDAKNKEVNGWMQYGDNPKPKPTPSGKSRGRRPGEPAAKPIPKNQAIIEAITLMVSCGVTQATIARLIGMSVPTMVKRYRKELDYGKDILTARVANALIQKALDGNVAAQQFYLKSRAGWKEPTQVEMTGKDGAPLISGVEREQRMMRIMMQNPEFRQKLQEKKEQKLIDVTPEKEEAPSIF